MRFLTKAKFVAVSRSLSKKLCRPLGVGGCAGRWRFAEARREDVVQLEEHNQGNTQARAENAERSGKGVKGLGDDDAAMDSNDSRLNTRELTTA